MNSTQDHLNIEDIKDGILLLRGGGGSLVIKTTAVNFELLSEREQVSIIDSFAHLLNSLSFAIQIMIRSQRLDISSYINMLSGAQRAQINPLLANMIGRYRQFVQSLVKENEVLDKQFFIVLNVSSLELGIGRLSPEERLNKIKAILSPRRDQILRQLSRVGLSGVEQNSENLIRLFYSIYNQVSDTPQAITTNHPVQAVRLSSPYIARPQNRAVSDMPPAVPQQPLAPPPDPSFIPMAVGARTHPFVVEELNENV